MPKVVFVGAGSVVFAKNLLTDVFSFPELADCEIVLVDVDADRLERTATIGEALVEHNDLGATVSATTDRREALPGADYVLNMIHVGGEEPFRNEIEIPAKYGVGQAVGDTLGPGGVFRAQRTIPTMLDIARDMEELCPDALLINYTNPMAMVCWAVDEATEVDVVGLCHSVQHTASAIASYVDVPYEEIEYRVAGINHLAWFLELSRDGEDLYPALREAMADPETYRKDNVRFELLEHFGYFVTESSHHVSEYLPYFRTEEERIEELTVEDADSYAVGWMPTGEYFEHWRSYQPDDEFDLASEDLSIERSEEYGSRIVHSMETGERRRMNVNVRNDTGAIRNLPGNALVEVPCLVDGNGVNPCAVGDLPPQLAALDRSNVHVQELAVKAALERDREALSRAVKLDPLTGAALGLDEIEAMVEELLAANADYLPEYE